VHPIPKSAALLVVDVQRGFDDAAYWGPRNNPDAERNVARLLEAWRRTARPVFYVRHMSTSPRSPLHPGQPGNEIQDVVRPLPGEPVLEKSVNSAFIGTNLESRLRTAGIATVVVTGLTTNHCVSTTARMAANLGFATYVVSDATATFDLRGPDGRLYPAGEMHVAGLVELHEEFATILDTESVLARL
jgi:nicotinamidase-related amidase